MDIIKLASSNEGAFTQAHEDNSRGGSEWHGSGGEVRISDIPERALSPIATAFHTAAQQAGHDANPDQNSLAPAAAAATAQAGGAQLGVQVYQCFVDERVGDGRRVTASRAFLPVKNYHFCAILGVVC